MLGLQVDLLIFDLVAEEVLGEELDLLVDVARFLKQLIVHLNHTFLLDL